MNLSDIKQWIVSADKLARPINPFDYDSTVEYTAYERFATFANQNTYATDLEPGIYDGDRVEVVYEYNTNDGDGWFDCDETYYQSMIRHNIKYSNCVCLRQFLRLKQQPKELNVCQTCKGVSSKYCSNAFHLVRPLNPNANAIKVIQDRISELDETKSEMSHQIAIWVTKYIIDELNHILKLLQS